MLPMVDSGDGSQTPPAPAYTENLFTNNTPSQSITACNLHPEQRWDFSVCGSLGDDHAAYLSEISADLDSWGSCNSDESIFDLLSHGDESLHSNESANSERSLSPFLATTCSNNNQCDNESIHDRRQACHPSATSMMDNSLAPRSEVTLQHTICQAMNVQYFSPFRPGIVPLPLQSSGTKRPCPPEFFEHIDMPHGMQLVSSSVSRRKSIRTLSRRSISIPAGTNAVVAAAAAAATATDPASVAWSAVVVPPPISSAAVSKQAGLRSGAPSKRPRQHLYTSCILQCCKFISKQTHQECTGSLSVVTHKRGHLTVSCSAKHQWVWCVLCCNCHNSKELNPGSQHPGCTNPSHWFERDAFDTGARNHMNVHKATSEGKILNK